MPLKPLLYTESILFSDFLFACREEIDVEAMLIERQAKPSEDSEQVKQQ